jgi:D-alanine transfer protein
MQHLAAAVAALLLSLAALLGLKRYAEDVEYRHIYAVASENYLQEKILGVALQTVGMRSPDLLPTYGSSEMYNRPAVHDYHPSTLFSEFPSGFTIFLVAKEGQGPLIALQRIAALGDAVKGRKLVVSFTPNAQYELAPEADDYAGNFSALQAYELAFSDRLGFDFKQRAARRLLDYPGTLEGHPVLRFGLERLLGGSPLDRATYDALYPLAKLQIAVLRLQDHYETLETILANPVYRAPVTRRATRLDWPSLMTKAIRDTRGMSTNNPFGLNETFWASEAGLWEENGERRVFQDPTAYLSTVEQAQEWRDLDLLLDGLRRLEAQPLLIIPPIPGEFLDYAGVPATARERFYTKLHSVTEPYGFPVLDFADFREDRAMLYDLHSHPSGKTSVLISQALDAFYHGDLGALAATGAATGTATVTATVPPAASFWRLDELEGTVARDATGQADGVYEGAALGLPGASADGHRAAAFDGEHDRVTFGEVYDFAGTAPFSVEAWVFPTLADQRYRRIISKDTWDGTFVHGWSLVHQWDRYVFARHDASGEGQEVSGSDPLPMFRWSHLVATYDGAEMRLYRNGVRVGAAPSSAALPSLGLRLGVGASAEEPGSFRGRIEDVAIYTSSLSDEQVRALYRSRLRRA